jgi:hypothetical protein
MGSRITHLTSSPTYPVAPLLKPLVGRGPTRRIRIRKPRLFPPGQFEQIINGQGKGFKEESWIVSVKGLKGESLEVTFNSVRNAVSAMEKMMAVPEFEGCAPRFARDYGDDEEDGVGGEVEIEEKRGERAKDENVAVEGAGQEEEQAGAGAEADICGDFESEGSGSKLADKANGGSDGFRDTMSQDGSRNGIQSSPHANIEVSCCQGSLKGHNLDASTPKLDY